MLTGQFQSDYALITKPDPFYYFLGNNSQGVLYGHKTRTPHLMRIYLIIGWADHDRLKHVGIAARIGVVDCRYIAALRQEADHEVRSQSDVARTV